MSPLKRERSPESGAPESDLATSDGISGTSSGVRLESERETTPAPAPTSEDDLRAPVSARPTEVPRYDVVAHAYEASLRHPPPPRLPTALAIPVRTASAAHHDLELRAAFVLLHVDGRTSIAEIASFTSLAVEEVSALFVSLVADGLVTL